MARQIPASNRQWLREHLSPYVFIAMQDEPDALALLTRELGSLQFNNRLILADREKTHILALRNRPGSLYETLRQFPERAISYAMFAHSDAPLPGLEDTLELQRLEFSRTTNQEILDGPTNPVPQRIRAKIARELRVISPSFKLQEMDRLLRLLWLNNESYVRVSPPKRVALSLSLLHEGNCHGGLFLDLQDLPDTHESRILFAVGNPPPHDFLLQLMEVFKRLDIGINRAYCLTISNGTHPYFLGAFYVRCHSNGCSLAADSPLHALLREELASTQLISPRSSLYRLYVTAGLLKSSDAALVSALAQFAHTQLAHNQPDRFSLEEVTAAFTSHPEIAGQLVQLFRCRFDPGLADRKPLVEQASAAAREAVAAYSTGHRHLDETRRTIFHCALLLVQHTLKTNFFVLEKQALSFRIDPAYLSELGEGYRSDLPPSLPFRVTFFSARNGAGYHVGFSDIARGGWRTVITQSPDDLVAAGTTLFREAYVLAHTQHLKNKDIYEGGSKLVMLLDASNYRRKGDDSVTLALYKLQYAVANAFLDIYVTEGGVVADPRVVDYYCQDEPIELGPDENMHDAMIEAIAVLSKRRGYMLGIGIMSSKKNGINHKEFGVTSTGVVSFAEITMHELGISIRTDPFRVKFTGGPNGDVAGNALRIMLDQCPQMLVTLVLDGTAAVVDPDGINRDELGSLVLRADLDSFDPARLGPHGFMLYRSGRRQDGLRELYRRVSRQGSGLHEAWISVDDFHHEFDGLVFTTPADLFIPAGGRPETIDQSTWERFILPDGMPSARVIVEGANSYLTPEARRQLQARGVLIMRDASANKCGVISSSYEIIANLLLNEDEFAAHKERYVADVLKILQVRAEAEARLILRRKKESPATLMTDISEAISREINNWYARLFSYFQDNPSLCTTPLFRRAILNHLPRILQEEPMFRRRITRFPPKYRFAILAAEIGASLVYSDDQTVDLAELIKRHLHHQKMLLS